MDAIRFDRLIKTLAAPASRRGALAALLTGIAAPRLPGSFAATGRGSRKRHGKHRGSGPGQLDGPFGVAVAPNGNVYVADSANNRIAYFDASGGVLGDWGSLGNGDGQFTDPTGIAVAADRSVYVADLSNNRVQVFDPDGTFLGAWGSGGSGEGAFKQPAGVAIGAESTVYVVDSGNNRLQAFCVVPEIGVVAAAGGRKRNRARRRPAKRGHAAENR